MKQLYTLSYKNAYRFNGHLVEENNVIILLSHYRYLHYNSYILEYLDGNNYKGLRRLKKIALQTIMSHDRFDVINNSLKTKRKIGTMTSYFSLSILYCRRRQYYFKRVLRCVQQCLV